MPKLCFTLLILLVTLSSCTKHSTSKKEFFLPKGWFYSHTNSGVKLLQAAEEKELYHLNFDRKGEQPEDAYYIQTAEALFPTQEKIRSNARIKVKSWYFERLWWGDEHKGFRIPFSITGDAVIYYIEKYKEFKEKFKSYSKEKVWNKGIGERVKFKYTATVDREFELPHRLSTLKRNDEKPIRVTLNLEWYYYCGQPCGWGFEQKREVIFLSKNKIASISGDGKARMWDSKNDNLFAPDQWITY